MLRVPGPDDEPAVVLTDTENLFGDLIRATPPDVSAQFAGAAHLPASKHEYRVSLVQDAFTVLVRWLDEQFGPGHRGSHGKDSDSSLKALAPLLSEHHFSRHGVAQGKNMADFSLVGDLMQRLMKPENFRFVIGSGDGWVISAAAHARDGLVEAAQRHPPVRKQPEFVVVVPVQRSAQRKRFAAGGEYRALGYVTLKELLAREQAHDATRTKPGRRRKKVRSRPAPPTHALPAPLPPLAAVLINAGLSGDPVPLPDIAIDEGWMPAIAAHLGRFTASHDIARSAAGRVVQRWAADSEGDVPGEWMLEWAPVVFVQEALAVGLEDPNGSEITALIRQRVVASGPDGERIWQFARDPLLDDHPWLG